MAADASDDEKKVAPEPLPVQTSAAEKREFQAETRRLLDIVAKSLYKDRKVFVRELISNAADALEKRRHAVVASGGDASGVELKINITYDDVARTVTITDTGIGMSHDELINNLGTIARSGTQAFVDQLKSSNDTSGAAANVIGRFGVGFYSVFIVGDKVTVYSRTHEPDAKGYIWESDGGGSYTIAEASGVAAGTRIVIHLNKESSEFAGRYSLEGIIKQYSNFVAFPIQLDGERVNTIQPLWTKPRSTVTVAEHNEFFRFVAHAYEDPAFHLHFVADVPIDIKSVLYFPRSYTELDQMMSSGNGGVSLYSRRVLIAAKPAGLLPEWLRFVRGVIDSEDLPLNISREFSQDSALMRNLNRIVTRRITKHLEEELAANRPRYALWFKAFGKFIKEGVYTADTRSELADLLLVDSSKREAMPPNNSEDFDNPPPTTLTTLREYVDRMLPEQKCIYYTIAPSRAVADASPYLDAFRDRNTEVLYLYEPADEFVMQRLRTYAEKTIVAIESDEIESTYKTAATPAAATPPDATGLTEWLKGVYASQVKDVKVATRAMSVPALVVGHDSAVVQKLKRMMLTPGASDAVPNSLEINLASPVIVAMDAARSRDPELAKLVAEQVLSNAEIAAGLVDDARPMLKRLDRILEAALKK